jgi:hypothetical protein
MFIPSFAILAHLSYALGYSYTAFSRSVGKKKHFYTLIPYDHSTARSAEITNELLKKGT